MFYKHSLVGLKFIISACVVLYLNCPSVNSFFAGYMTKDEADNALKNGENGTFLIRFSSTNAVKGSFVVVLKTPYGTEYHEIKVITVNFLKYVRGV